MDYDIVLIGDFRFPGGTSTAVAAEIQAQTAAGYRTALIQIKGPVLRYPHPIHPEIRRLIDDGSCDLVDAAAKISAGLALIHHPQVFEHLPAGRLAVEAARHLLVAHQPPLDATGTAFYDWRRIDRNLEQVVGRRVPWAPVGPNVRAAFARVEDPPDLFPDDWHNVLDPAPWRFPQRGPVADRPVIGRHSRPDPLKWPDSAQAILEAYPDDPAILVRVLGAGPFLLDLLGRYPANWQVSGFDHAAPPGFLRSIDFFVFFHHSRWIEAFGRNVLEALASGCVVVLPHSFAPLFGPAALYAERPEVPALVRALWQDRGRFTAQSGCGAEAVARRFGPPAHQARLARLLDPPKAGRTARPPWRRRRVLFFASNGVGLGHLTRTLAIARRLAAPSEPVFLSLSQAVGVVEQFGFAGQYLPFHAYLRSDQRRWNRKLRLELEEALAFYTPDVLVFDGNMPYTGLLEAAAAFPTVYLVWCRRGLWRPSSGAAALEREDRFDAVIEPEDLAAVVDAGPTPLRRARTRAVGPILLFDEAEQLEAGAARAALGLAPSKTTVLVQLGSGNNYDLRALRDGILRALIGRPEVEVALAASPISEARWQPPAGVVRLDVYPLAPYLKAFDAAVSATGYNSFHELLLGGRPTVFVPNEHPMMDDQLARARFAERVGLGLCLRARDLYRIDARLDALLDPDVRRDLQRRMATIARPNGAQAAARIIEEMALSLRADRAF